MITINGHKVIFSDTFIVSDTTDTFVDFTSGIWHVKIRLRFEVIEGQAVNFVGRGEGDVFHLTCTNWNSPMGASMAPLKFAASSAGHGLFLQLFHEKVGAINRVTLQVHEEAPNA